PGFIRLKTFSSRFAPNELRSDSPDSALLAIATLLSKNLVSICPQLAYGSLGWSQTVESPRRKIVGTLTEVISNFRIEGCEPLNSSVNFSSHAHCSEVFSRSFS